jgi:carbonic anhydrase
MYGWFDRYAHKPADDLLGGLEYAARVIGVKLILVGGHFDCGAVKGTIDGVQLAI